MNNRLFRHMVIGGVLLWFALFALLPNLFIFGASFFERGMATLVEPLFTLDNYRKLLDPAFLTMLVRSIWYAGMAMLLCLVVGYPFAFIVARAPRRLEYGLLVMVMIPFWTNSLIRTYALVMILKADGMINRLLLASGWIEQPLALMYSQTAVFIGLVYMLLPFMILPLYAAIKKLDFTIVNAARDLGAGRLQTLRSVIIPLTMPGIVAGCMLVFLPALGMFYIPDILGGARSMLLGNYVRDQFLSFRNLPLGSAASLAMTAMMGLMLLLYYISRRGGAKGDGGDDQIA